MVFVIDTLALAALFRFLSGAAMPWRRMWIGSLLGSAALTVLQLLGGLVITGAGQNPLLATFAVFIALLLWFRLTGIVILVAASWIAVEALDAHESLRLVTPEQLVAEERAREQHALVTAAQVRVRDAAAGARRRRTGSGGSRRVADSRRRRQELAACGGRADARRRRRSDVGGLP